MMDKKVEFSIIVPVYNVAGYLKQCLDSILDQSFFDYEIILVDDGSTDHSGRICDDYAALYENIRVIHKQNGGLSDARNAGIAESVGEYVVFVDSDDYIEKDALRNFHTLLDRSKGPEVLITRLKQVYESLPAQYMDENMPFDVLNKEDKKNITDWVFSHSQNTWPSVKYILKRSLIDQYDIKFKAGFFHEDIDWTTTVFIHADSFACLDYYWYNHRMGRRDSITTIINAKRTLDVIRLVCEDIKRFSWIDKELKKIVFNRLVLSLFASLGNFTFFNNEDKERIIKELSENMDVLKYASCLRHKAFVLYCKFFGLADALRVMGAVQNKINI